MAGRNFRSLWSDAVAQQARKIFTRYTKSYVYPFYLVLTICNDQTHLKLEYGEPYLISIKRYQDDEDESYYFITDYIEKHLIECVNRGSIDESSPIYNLGFAKKSYIEMLVCYGLPITEEERINTQSPDLAFDDAYFEVDYHTFEMIVADRDDLRARLGKQQLLVDKLLVEN